MKKIIAFTDTEELCEHYKTLIEKGAKPVAGNIFGISSELRRAEVKTKDGHELELVYISVQLGDLLLWNREACEVDIDRVLDAMEIQKAKLLKRIRAMKDEDQAELEVA